MLHQITAHFHALRHEGDIGNRDEESIPIGSIVDVTSCWFEGQPDSPVAVVLFTYEGNDWDAIFDSPDDNGVLAPIGTFRPSLQHP